MKPTIASLSKLDKQDYQNTQVIEQSFIQLVGEMKYESITLPLLSKETGIDQNALSKYYPTKKSLLNKIQQTILSDFSWLIIEKEINIPNAINELKKKATRKQLSRFLATYHPFFQTAINPTLFFDFQRTFCLYIESFIKDYYFSSTLFSEQRKKTLSHYNAYVFFGLLTALNEQLTENTSNSYCFVH